MATDAQIERERRLQIDSALSLGIEANERGEHTLKKSSEPHFPLASCRVLPYIRITAPG
ncbi:hypothetical protein [Acetobacter aceti]|uniref:hypothetical protein n=1 Tax=Acetobacter aceti TaxID=435 RepID=UPI0015E0B54A|nr:hypothetical protein [Acetobacter aceti]